jgi:branched-chain amino acid transport system permease protein
VPVLPSLLGGGIVAMLGGVVVGMPSLRVKGLYLAIATIAASCWRTSCSPTSSSPAAAPASRCRRPAFSGCAGHLVPLYWWLVLPLTCAMLLGAANLFRTRIGRAFIAIRDRDISAEVLGIPLLRYKLLSFAISSFYAGVAGGLWAYFFRAVTPESFPLLMSSSSWPPSSSAAWARFWAACWARCS